MNTGEAIAIEPEQLEMDLANDSTELPTNRTISIGVSGDGKISLNIEGQFQVHEVFGALYTTLADLTIQQFVNPGLKLIIQANRSNAASIVGEVQSIKERIDSMSNATSSDAGKNKELIEGLTGLLKTFDSK